ncbi:Gfo/Idh/MocA family protein [Planococcus lenghuensis]|uniref:Oxidoreductase n=1 Tax=Planococcus lenghuensis TaxID=2213202 RepID=A0A1Q2KUQ8_9BACL|nr:Gfo/Idh/MocA family oxidoreductase [Planococcus lenghuensis]AQQ51854.1 oxidoreductase [Planococcus lenghuensis]
MKKLKVGIAGPGGIAKNAHIPGYQQHREAEVTAVFSRSVERAAAAARKFSIPQAYNDYSDMLNRAELDAVSICVPNKFHAEMTIQALEAGCHVFCEKPPAMSADEVRKMQQVAERTGKVLTFNLHNRHSREVQAIRSCGAAGELGHIYAARVHALRRRGIPGWGVFTDKELQGGGPLIDIGVHMLDTALYLMDYPEPDTVLAVSHQQIGPRTDAGLMGQWNPATFSVEDALMGLIRFKDGQSLVIETSFALNMEQAEQTQVELFGDRGGAAVFPPRLFQDKAGQPSNTEFPFLKNGNMSERSVADFVESCFGRKEPLVKVEEAVRLQQLIDALYQSADCGKAISI